MSSASSSLDCGAYFFVVHGCSEASAYSKVCLVIPLGLGLGLVAEESLWQTSISAATGASLCTFADSTS